MACMAQSYIIFTSVLVGILLLLVCQSDPFTAALDWDLGLVSQGNFFWKNMVVDNNNKNNNKRFICTLNLP